ncbi:hypothetical protein OIU78_015029, partial [Salix suchowensis]
MVILGIHSKIFLHHHQMSIRSTESYLIFWLRQLSYPY